MITIIKMLSFFIIYMTVGNFLFKFNFKDIISSENMEKLETQAFNKQQMKKEILELDKELVKNIKKEKDKLSYPTPNEKFQFEMKVDKLKNEYFFDRKAIINKYK